jgi:hypothetical protein
VFKKKKKRAANRQGRKTERGLKSSPPIRTSAAPAGRSAGGVRGKGGAAAWAFAEKRQRLCVAAAGSPDMAFDQARGSSCGRLIRY